MRSELELGLLENSGRIIIGISGGADSVALTHILFTRLGGEKLLCAHVNHMLRGAEADRDEAFVRGFCEKYGLALKVLKKDVAALAAKEGIGTEECGRRVRYGFFNSLVASEADLIATAHNADDNAETVLMNLARGTGLKGLCGIPARRGNIVRPILSKSRSWVEDYCRENGLDYVTDSTNLTDEYKRNIVRHQASQALKTVNASFVENVTRSSALLTDDEDYMKNEAAGALAEARNEYGLDACKVKRLHIALKRRVLYSFLAENGGENIEKKHIDLILPLLGQNGSVNVPPSLLVTVKQNCLTVTAGSPLKMPQVRIEGPQTVLPNGKRLSFRVIDMEKKEKINNLLFNNCFDYDTIKNVLTVGGRRQGDKMLLPGRNVTKSLKKLFNELKVPAAVRDRVVVLKDGDQVVFVEGVGVSPIYAVTEKTEHAVEIVLEPVT